MVSQDGGKLEDLVSVLGHSLRRRDQVLVALKTNTDDTLH
jgi:hypothetical protein